MGEEEKEGEEDKEGEEEKEGEEGGVEDSILDIYL